MKLIICILGLTAMALAVDEEPSAVLKESNNQFTAQMFYEVATKNVGQSVILSAFSVMPPLAQLALASVDESHDELLKAIGFPNDNVTKSAFSSLNQQLRSVKGVDLKMANRIYIAQDAELNTQFAALSKDVFNSEVKNVEFEKNVATAAEINSWVEDQTNHKIKDLVDPGGLSSATRAVLVNAIYFKGSWNKKFDTKLTTDRDFHVSKDKTVKVPTMTINDELRYGESAELDAKLLELPYEGQESSFLIVLPNQIDGIVGLQEKLKDSSLLTKAVQEMTTFEVDVRLPKFKIETKTDLKEVLQKMNVNKIFNPKEAKLNNLLAKESNLFITDAIQKAFIEVNEEGAEAAAANAILIGVGSSLVSPVKEPKSFVVDRPFYFEIVHPDLTLFNGALLQP